MNSFLCPANDAFGRRRETALHEPDRKCVRENITNTTPAGAGIGVSKATATYNINCRINRSDDTNCRSLRFIQSQALKVRV